MRHFYNAGALTTASLLLVSLTGCGDIGYNVNPGGADSSAPPPSLPATPPEPTPPPPPPPPPPPSAVPPLSSDVVDLTDGHGIGVSRWPDPQTDGAPFGRFNCVINPPQALEFRAHLSILLNNEFQKV